MLNLIALFGTSFAVALSGALMPGPLLTVTISESARRGVWAGPQLIAGHAVLEFIMVIILLMGVGPLLQSDTAFIIIAFAGSAVLLWMAAGMFMSFPAVKLESGSVQREFAHPVFAGFMMSLANPYWVLWWAVIGLGYVTLSMTYGLSGVISFFTGHISADLAWYTLVSAGISKGKHFINDTVYRAIIGICASVITGFAFWFLYSGIHRLMF